MKHLAASEARAFAEEWLAAWSGNNPELLARFYSDDALSSIRRYPVVFEESPRYPPNSHDYWLTSPIGSGRSSKASRSRLAFSTSSAP
jgi:hypothetical protein